MAPIPRRVARAGSYILALGTALGFIFQYRAPTDIAAAPFGRDGVLSVPPAMPAPSAFGRSGAVHMRFTLPNQPVEYPLQVQGDPAALSYEWVRLADSVAVGAVRLLGEDELTAPADPGFYRLALVRGTVRRIVDGLTVSVLVPFDEKRGPTLDGYRLGTFLAERKGRAMAEHPEGFVKVTSALAAVPVSKHLRVGDFLVRDNQQHWPRYTAINPRVLDKLELVVAELSRMRGDRGHLRIELDVHSGFRSPSYNASVSSAASDSRHQYGDAIDVAIDADGDGRLTVRDTKLVTEAVDRVETQHPDLIGGVGTYTGRRYKQPFVHIDARGTRARWRG